MRRPNCQLPACTLVGHCIFVEERTRAGKIIFRGNYLQKYVMWFLRLHKAEIKSYLEPEGQGRGIITRAWQYHRMQILEMTSAPCIHNIISTKIQQIKMLLTCQRFDDLSLFGMVWQYSTNQNQYDKVQSYGYLLTVAI